MKIGRNNLCPCGSGKKYKQCCIDIKEITTKKELPDGMVDTILNLRTSLLNKKEHIIEYRKIRNIHGEVLDSMIDFLYSDKYPIAEVFQNVVIKVLQEFEIKLDLDKEHDTRIFYDIAVYPNKKELTSITDIYLKNNKFRKEEKVKMLEAMKDSYVGLFKINNIDFDNGYLEIEDVFNKRKFKIIDIALSSSTESNVYLYNRIITYNGLSFSSGINLFFQKDNKFIKDYIKSYNNYNINYIAETLKLLKIYKSSSLSHNINYL